MCVCVCVYVWVCVHVCVFVCSSLLACARAIGGVTRYLAQEGGGGHTQGPIFSDPWHRDNRRKMEDTYDGDIYVCR